MCTHRAADQQTAYRSDILHVQDDIRCTEEMFLFNIVFNRRVESIYQTGDLWVLFIILISCIVFRSGLPSNWKHRRWKLLVCYVWKRFSTSKSWKLF